MRSVALVGLFFVGALSLAACGHDDGKAQEPAPPPLPAAAPVADWVPSPDFPTYMFVCWDQPDPSKPGISTMVGSPSQIPVGATNVRKVADCNPPHLHDGS